MVFLEMSKNQILTISVVLLLILTPIFFLMDSPYWYLSILTLAGVISIILIKIMWNVSGWATDQFHEFVDKNKE